LLQLGPQARTVNLMRCVYKLRFDPYAYLWEFRCSWQQN